jgi:hypothetical protein
LWAGNSTLTFAAIKIILLIRNYTMDNRINAKIAQMAATIPIIRITIRRALLSCIDFFATDLGDIAMIIPRIAMITIEPPCSNSYINVLLRYFQTMMSFFYIQITSPSICCQVQSEYFGNPDPILLVYLPATFPDAIFLHLNIHSSSKASSTGGSHPII